MIYKCPSGIFKKIYKDGRKCMHLPARPKTRRRTHCFFWPSSRERSRRPCRRPSRASSGARPKRYPIMLMVLLTNFIYITLHWFCVHLATKILLKTEHQIAAGLPHFACLFPIFLASLIDLSQSLVSTGGGKPLALALVQSEPKEPISRLPCGVEESPNPSARQISQPNL